MTSFLMSGVGGKDLDDPSVDSFFNVVGIETLALFEHLPFEFLNEFNVFALTETGKARDHKPPELTRGFLHYYYKHEGVIEQLL
jgi:hypothetical protein